MVCLSEMQGRKFNRNLLPSCKRELLYSYTFLLPNFSFVDKGIYPKST